MVLPARVELLDGQGIWMKGFVLQ